MLWTIEGVMRLSRRRPFWPKRNGLKIGVTGSPGSGRVAGLEKFSRPWMSMISYE